MPVKDLYWVKCRYPKDIAYWFPKEAIIQATYASQGGIEARVLLCVSVGGEHYDKRTGYWFGNTTWDTKELVEL